MKYILIFLIVTIGTSLQAQKYLTKTGLTEFKASVEAFEPVEAINNSTTAILNTTNGAVAALMFIKAFKFKIALMEEHFNENYMDSGQFPKASFKGNLDQFELSKISDIPTLFDLNGTLTIRGIAKQISTKATIQLINNTIKVTADFIVKPTEFGIEIPSIVSNKIAETINIKLDYDLIKKN